MRLSIQLLMCVLLAYTTIPAVQGDTMKVRQTESSTIVSTIKYILDELLLDLHSPSISTKSYNRTRQMFYNSSTKWNSEYSIEKGNGSSPADEYSIMLVNEFVLDDVEDAVNDFYSTNHTLKPIHRNTVTHEINDSQDQQQQSEVIDSITETAAGDENIDNASEETGIDSTTEIAAEDERIYITTEIAAEDDFIDNFTEITADDEIIDNTTEITPDDERIDITTEIAAEDEIIDNTTETTADDERIDITSETTAIDTTTEIADENKGIDNTTEITDIDNIN